MVWKRKDRIMSLKREEIAIEDEPPGLEAVGTATLHDGRTATGWHLAERGPQRERNKMDRRQTDAQTAHGRNGVL